MRRLGVWVVGFAVVAAGCGGDDEPAAPVELGRGTTVELEPGSEPVALAPIGDGEILVGERRTGVIRTIDAGGELSPPVAQVDAIAGEDDQRGLLGLVADGERIYAAWTRAGDGHIVVAEVTGGTERLVWLGPPSSERANGGHLDILPDGRLLIGIGDLLEPERLDDPDTPHGKLLALDPAGAPEQVPEALSSGWNNPFAFVVTSNGEVWVADNAPGDEPERIGRGDRDAQPSELPGKRAPAALVEIGPGLLALCGYLDGDLVLVDVRQDEPELGATATSGCRTGATTVGPDRVAVSDGQSVRILTKRG